MKKRIFFYLKYILFWIGVQYFFRMLFLILYHGLGEGLGLYNKLLTFTHGFKHDISLTGYVLILPTLIISFFALFRNSLTRKIIDIYTALILTVLIILFVANLVIYQFWNFPIDKSIFQYINTPKEMAASVTTIQLVLLLTGCLVLFLVFWILVYRKFISGTLRLMEPDWRSSGLFIFLLPMLLLPIRGGTGIVPLNTGSVYFHRNEFANHAAVNPVWNMVYTITEGNRLNPQLLMVPESEAKIIHDTLHPCSSPVPSVISTEKPNIVIIFLESFGSTVIAELGGKTNVTPEFSRLIRDGIFFTNFYATGTMTDRALSGILSGYPALQTTCIIHFERKSQTLPFISKDLQNAGYHTEFIYGGDIDFAHMKSYLITGNFEKIISERDFPAVIKRAKWGVPDQYLFEKLLEECDNADSPFFYIGLTLSSHNPFDVPAEPVFPGNSYEIKFHNSVWYTDHYLGEFIIKARERIWWENTLVILIADHGTRIGNVNEYDRERFHIPMLWTGGVIKERGVVINHYGSQTDLPKMLLDQLGLPACQYTFSKNLLDSKTPSFAYYSYQNGFGFVSDSLYLVYHIPTNSFYREEGSQASLQKKTGLAYMQYVLSDFTNR